MSPPLTFLYHLRLGKAKEAEKPLWRLHPRNTDKRLRSNDRTMECSPHHHTLPQHQQDSCIVTGDYGDWLCGLVVEFRVLCFIGLGSVPGCGPTPRISGHTMTVTHTQNRGRLTADVSSEWIFLSKKITKQKKRKVVLVFKWEEIRKIRILDGSCRRVNFISFSGRARQS